MPEVFRAPALPHPLSLLRLIIDELADVAGQLITVEQGAITFHLDRATLSNVAAQLKDAIGE